MTSIPHQLSCYSWNVQQRTKATSQITESGVEYNEYVLTTTVSLIEEGEGVPTFIGLQGLSTLTFKKLQSELINKYEDHVLCQFTPHSMSYDEWNHNYEANYESENMESKTDNEMKWFGNMAIYFSGFGASCAISAKGIRITCDSYELHSGSSAMPCITIDHQDGTRLHMICVHLAKIENLRNDQHVQLSKVLCNTNADLTIIAGVINESECFLPGYNNSTQLSTAKSYPSHDPEVAASDIWAVNTVCNSLEVKHSSANALRLLHIEEISSHLPISRMITLCQTSNRDNRLKFVCRIN